MISPCVNICRIENGVCVGCRRTGQEIFMWTRLTDDERVAIMSKLTERDHAQTQEDQIGTHPVHEGHAVQAQGRKRP